MNTWGYICVPISTVEDDFLFFPSFNFMGSFEVTLRVFIYVTLQINTVL